MFYGLIKSTLAAVLVFGLAAASPGWAEDGENNGCPPQRIGYIEDGESNVPDLIDGLSKWFPSDWPSPGLFTAVVLQDDPDVVLGIDDLVEKMEDVVEGMKADGIMKIIVNTSSDVAGPFIEGTAGGLGGFHSDDRHPDVIFSGVRQGTPSVDNAQNWYRLGTDFFTERLTSPPEVLPEVSAVMPQPDFILATDGSAAVSTSNAAYVAHADGPGGYNVVVKTLVWDPVSELFTAASVAALSDAIAAAPPESRVGLSVTSADVFNRYTALTSQGLADSDIFDPNNANVTYVGINYLPFSGDFSDPGSIPVDLLQGFAVQDENIWDPRGVNKYLLRIGYPNDPTAAVVYNRAFYSSDGTHVARAYVWFATCDLRKLDKRNKVDANRQAVGYYIRDSFLPAGNPFFLPIQGELLVNPRWEALP